MKKQQIKAFTLVELIIVITILAILATIGFISYQSYTLDARDGKRVSDLGQIRKGLEIYQTKNSVLPSPDAQITNIVNGTSVLEYQGYAGTNVLNKIRADQVQDPKDNTQYTYSTNGDYTKFQLMSMLENGSAVNLSQTPVNTTYAATDYTTRKTYVAGNKLGVFLDNTTKAPIQETLSGNIDLGGSYSGTSFKVVFSNTSTNSGTIVGSGVSLYNNVLSIANTVATTQVIKAGEQTNPGLSCLDILNKGGSIGDGTYWIKPDTNPAFQVYCDMTADGGGWTRVFDVTFPGTSCSFTASAKGNITSTTGCDKLSDTAINNIASEKIFRADIPSSNKMYSKYSGYIDNSGVALSVGQIVNSETYSGVKSAALLTPGYSGFIGFTQHNWYQTSTTLGSLRTSCRLSLEYTNNTSSKYACCDSSCSTKVNTGTAYVFIK